MAVAVSIIIPAKTAEASQVTQYTSSAGVTLIDKFTATNYSGAAASISVNLVSAGNSPSNNDLIVKTRVLQAGETYTFPELVGAAVGIGGYISTLASAGSSINIRASGRIIT